MQVLAELLLDVLEQLADKRSVGVEELRLLKESQTC